MTTTTCLLCCMLLYSLQDSHIGTATLNLSQLQPAQLKYIELPLVWTKDKYGQQGKQSKLVVGVAGWVASFGTLMRSISHMPGRDDGSCLVSIEHVLFKQLLYCSVGCRRQVSARQAMIESRHQNSSLLRCRMSDGNTDISCC